MVGGGAVFFHLYTADRLKNKSILIDVNRELMNCYEAIRDNLGELISMLEVFKKRYNEYPEEIYYHIRGWDRKKDFMEKSKVERVARTIFLNRTCYNIFDGYCCYEESKF